MPTASERWISVINNVINNLELAVFGLPKLQLLDMETTTGSLPAPETLLLPVLIIVLLVILNGIYVAAEFAIIAVRPTQAEQMAKEGKRAAKRVFSILESHTRKDRYIATAQLGITLASLGLGMYGEPHIAHFIEPYLALLIGVLPSAALVHSVSYIISLSLLTYLHVVIGEMIPKSWALTAPHRVVIIVSGTMRITQTLFALPVYLMNSVSNALLRLFHVPTATERRRLHSLEELEQIVTESTAGGVLTEEEENILLNILEFGGRRVSQVMIPRNKLQAIPHDASLTRILDLASESQFTRFPVCEGDLDHIIGVLHVKDLVRHQIQFQGESFDIKKLLRSVPHVPEQTRLARLLATLKYQRINMAIVLDEYGGTAGAVTVGDVVEEIVGGVRDEFDLEPDPILEIAPGVLDVAGHYLVDDLADYVDWGRPDKLPDVDTVSGLLMAWLGRPPRPDESYTYEDRIRFTVLAVEGRIATRVRVEYQSD